MDKVFQSNRHIMEYASIEANTHIRGRIGLGNIKSKRCVGHAKIVGSVEMTVEELKKHGDRQNKVSK
jgi:hypothetical protein